jgi:hypothetical protein
MRLVRRDVGADAQRSASHISVVAQRSVATAQNSVKEVLNEKAAG